MSHRARERTPADRDRCGWHKIVIRDRCGWHKIVIVAAGTMRPISIATPFWTLGTVSEIATGIGQIEDHADYFDTRRIMCISRFRIINRIAMIWGSFNPDRKKHRDCSLIVIMRTGPNHY
jgi:hypothetical protein